VDYFESHRTERRGVEELLIPADTRIELLQRNGFSSHAIDKSIRKSEEVRFQREKSVAGMQWDFVSATRESIGRKFKKAGIFGKKGRNKMMAAITA
jgi:hypothetical protein